METFNGMEVFDWGGYPAVYNPDHPMATGGGAVRIHRMVAFDVFGDTVVGKDVHHIDGNSKNNNPDNLRVLTRSEHASEHGRRAEKRWFSFKCGYCNSKQKREYRQVTRKLDLGQEVFFCSRSCGTKYHKTET